MDEILKFNLNTFFESCAISSNQAYENLKNILGWLENLDTQSQARKILTKIENFLLQKNTDTENIKKYHFKKPCLIFFQ